MMQQGALLEKALVLTVALLGRQSSWCSSGRVRILAEWFRLDSEPFQFETRSVATHTTCRFAGTARFFRSLWAGRRGAAASRFPFFKGKALLRAKNLPCWQAAEKTAREEQKSPVRMDPPLYTGGLAGLNNMRIGIAPAGALLA